MKSTPVTRLEKSTKRILDTPILKAHTSYRLPLFLPTDGRNAVRPTAASARASAEASSEKKKALVFNTALVHIVLQDGVAKAESQYQATPFSNEMIRLTSFGRVPNYTYWSWSSALASHLGYDARYISHALCRTHDWHTIA
jgi:hypothetical protein